MLEQTITSAVIQPKIIRRRFAIKIKPLLCDITNSSFWYHKSYFVTSTNNLWFCDIAKLILWSNDFVVSKKSNLWYHIFDFMISHNRFFDITKLLWFFISQNRICDIKKLILCYQKFILWFKNQFCGINKWIVWYQKSFLPFSSLE